ncbi:Alpha/Beta hydrolase protein [Panaeolus papilionaceus]|nr:Alpha/Beta hydrolase protein [Panaeolus papilionaceus]
MIALGYNEYVVQGGDWGQFIARRLLRSYEHKHAKAWHTNFPLAPPPHPIHRPFLLLSHFLWGYSEREKEGLKRTQWYQKKGSGYFAQQSTQPQTLGYSLADSPSGLLAWIYEKLILGSDEYPWTDDEVLTWLSIYWFSRAGPAASIRIYYEVVNANPGMQAGRGLDVTTVPMGHSYFPKEAIRLPRRWLQAPNLVFESEHERGGHFETPDALAGDLRRMFGSGGPAFGVVPGRTGYA